VKTRVDTSKRKDGYGTTRSVTRGEGVWILCPEEGFLDYSETFQTHNGVFHCEMETQRPLIRRRDATRPSLHESHDISVGINAHQIFSTVTVRELVRGARLKADSIRS
jgi:hypothetical protein